MPAQVCCGHIREQLTQLGMTSKVGSYPVEVDSKQEVKVCVEPVIVIQGQALTLGEDLSQDSA